MTSISLTHGTCRVTVDSATIAAILFCREFSFTGFSSTHCDEYYVFTHHIQRRQSLLLPTICNPFHTPTKRLRCMPKCCWWNSKAPNSIRFLSGSLQREDYCYEIQVLILAVSKDPQRLNTANEEETVSWMLFWHTACNRKKIRVLEL